MAQERKSSSCLLCVLIPLLSAPRPPSTRRIGTPCRQGHQTLAAALSFAIRLREHGTAAQTGFGAHTPVAQQPEGMPAEPVFEVECPLGHTTFPTISGVSTTANVFRKEGEYWTVSYEGTVVRLQESQGSALSRSIASPSGPRVPCPRSDTYRWGIFLTGTGCPAPRLERVGTGGHRRARPTPCPPRRQGQAGLPAPAHRSPRDSARGRTIR